MHFKTFTRLFLLMGMIGFLSAPMRAEEVTIGSGTATSSWLPSHSNWNYSLTQQLYKAEEIGEAGIITSIAFFNAGSTKTRTYDIYLVNTNKSSFSGASDWISVTSTDLVYSGSVEMTANTWKTIPFTNSFQYEGDNLAIIINDKTGSCSSGMSCRVFTPSGDQGVLTLYAYRDNPGNYDLSNPGNASGTVTNKNQIILDIEPAAVTCAKPKNVNTESITAHTATLTWTAGAEGQSNWDFYVTTTETDIPDENTTPTYQVMECSKALTHLTAQTTYYAYVRANCGGGDKSKWANKTFTTTREALAVDANNPYSQDFETNNDWGFTNGSQTNKWSWGSATNNGGAKAMYISNDNGTNYAYTLNSTTVVFASKLLSFAQGTYTFSFNWQAKGEGSSYNQYDYLRAVLIPGDVEFTAGSLPSGVGYQTLPESWIALDGGQQLNLQDGWQSQTTEATVSGTYTMVFIWRNDSSGGSQPPAAIDNISISLMNCPRPTNLTASNITGRTVTLSWTENGTATNWVLQYATDANFSENLVEVNVSGTPSKGLSSLSSETTYYARVKSILGSDQSFWSDVKDFTTTATCEKPTLSYVTNSNTAHTGSVSWTGNANNYELIYSTAYSFNPGDEGVTQIDLGNVNTYTLQDLAPETTYRIKVRANCGDDDGYSQWSNQVSFTTTATCIKPTGLTASNVTANTATITWTAGEGSQNAWNLQYKKSTESDWQSVPVTINSYNLTNLSPVTTYNVRVQADCGEGDLSQWTNNTNFTTGCAAIDLPYTCDFEGTSQTVNSCIIPNCWSVIRGYYNSTYRYGVPTMATQSTSTQPIVQATHSGSYSLYFLNSTNYGTEEEYAILPEISEDYIMNNIQIRFWVRSYSSACTMEVGIMTDPSNTSTYVKIEDVEITSTYTEKTVSLSNYSGNGRYIALKCPTPTMYSQAFYVDDITVEYNPSCLVPDNFEADEVTTDEATLTWTPLGTETAWNLQYKKASDSEWSEPIAVEETTYTLTGLQHSTVYEARVQANCDADEQSDWTDAITFQTDCADLSIPYFYDFESGIEEGQYKMPICWRRNTFTNNHVNYPYVYESLPTDYSQHAHGEGASSTSRHCLYFYKTSTSGNSNNKETAILPPVEEGIDMNKLQIRFWAKLWSQKSAGNTLTIGIMRTTAEATFEAISTVTINSTDYEEYVVPFTNYTGDGRYIAIRTGGTQGANVVEMLVDDITVEEIPNSTTIQTVQLAQDWNWFAPTADITLEQLEQALDANGISINSQTQFARYDEEDEEWSGDLMALVPGQMYKIQVGADCNFTLTGTSLALVTVSIEYGDNWFGHIGSETVTVEEALNGFTPAEGDKISSEDGSFTIYEDGEWGGNLLNLEPGRGYIYISQDTATKHITFTRNN